VGHIYGQCSDRLLALRTHPLTLDARVPLLRFVRSFPVALAIP